VNRFRSRFRSPRGSPALPLDRISTPAAFAWALYRLRMAYIGPLIRPRRSTDNAETDIGFATTFQTRQNILPNPSGAGAGVGGPPPTGWSLPVQLGITPSVTGLGTEDLQSYVEVRFAGTATAGGQLRPVLGFVNPVGAEVQFFASLGVRLVAGSFAGVTANVLRATYRNSGGAFINATSVAMSPTAVLQRWGMSRTTVANTGRVDIENEITVTSGAAIDFTVRYYLPNVEIGRRMNARPLADTAVTVVAAPGDLDVDQVEAFVGANNAFLWSEDQSNAAWSKTFVTATATDLTVTTNNSAGTSQILTVPNGPATLSTEIDPAGGTSPWVRLAILNDGSTLQAWFNRATGAIGAVDAGITAATQALANGNFRISITRTLVAGSTTFFIRLANGNSNLLSTVGATLRVLRSQVSAGSTAGFYIQTLGTAVTEPGSLFLATPYDQSGNVRHGVQATQLAQLRLANAGVMETRNGRPALTSQGNNQGFSFPLTVASGEQRTIAAVFGIDATLPNGELTGAGTGAMLDFGNALGGSNRVRIRNGASNTYSSAGSWPYSPDPSVALFRQDAARVAARRNGVTVVDVAAGTLNWPATNILVMMSDTANRGLQGSMQQYIWFAGALSAADEQILRQEQSAAYNIPVA
jgi:hypothetical protein